MLYHLLYPLHQYFGGFNVFRYITFRSAGATLTCFVLMLACMPAFIRFLQQKQIGQVIRDDGPESHFSKAGVPTMGGLCILAAVTVTVLLWADLTNRFVWLILAVLGWFGAIGAYDDYRKITRQHAKGLSAAGKMILQTGGALAVAVFLIATPGFDTQLSVPFFKTWRPELGVWWLPFAVVVITGASNAVNLTDGLDGLATGPLVITGGVYLIFAYLAGHAILAAYLQIPYVAGAGEVAVVCGALVGGGLGFLWYNAYPAEVFMGDTGSLALGAVIGTVATIIKQEILLIIVGGIFVVEALSVILQVGYFKMTGGKRIFLMAPYHHHFEKKGWQEPKVVVRFWIVSIALGLVALATLKLR